MILLSYPICNTTPVFGGKGFPIITSSKDMQAGDNCNTLECKFSTHTGTHLDCPYHFDLYGKKLTDYPVEFWFVKHVEVVHFQQPPGPTELITPDALIRLLEKPVRSNAEAVIIKTGYCSMRNTSSYWKDPPGIHPDMAGFLRKTFPKIRFLGLDLISITSFANREMGKKSHKAFLKDNHPILLIEDMNLNKIPELGIQNLLISPLYIKNADGAPCTVFGNIDTNGFS